MSGGLIDKVYIGLDNAPAAFDIKGRILGPVSFCIFGLEFHKFRPPRKQCNHFCFRMGLTWSI